MNIRSLLLALVLIALPALGGCESLIGPDRKAPEPLTALPRSLSAAERDVIVASNRFAFDLLREVDRADTASNVFLSPLSASMALGMTMNGARGETLDGMRSALGFGPMPLEDVNVSYRDLIDLLRDLDPGVDMRIANSIWAREGFPFEETFFQTTRDFFDAEVSALDFADPGAPATINDWVKRSTNGKIETIIDGGIPPDVVMYLINAIYFKGSWRQQFELQQTRDAPFTRADGSEQTVKMMYREGDVHHASLPGMEAVDLLYGREAFSMTVVLPAPGTDLDSLVATLDAEQWGQLTAQFTKREMGVYLPRFRLEYETKLNDPLIALGMNVAFGRGPQPPDFTGMSPLGRELYISEAKQKTFVEVNEEGTEAAAVTSVEMGVTSMPSRPPAFVVNRPFLVAIRERFSGAILFLGKVGAPPSSGTKP